MLNVFVLRRTIIVGETFSRLNVIFRVFPFSFSDMPLVTKGVGYMTKFSHTFYLPI